MAHALLYRRIMSRGLLAAVIVTLLWAYWNDPAPAGAALGACPFLAATGFQCPLCGGQRALHALLHGRLGTAWAANPLLVLSPLLLLFAVLRRHSNRGRNLAALGAPVAAVLLGVLRMPGNSLGPKRDA